MLAHTRQPTINSAARRVVARGRPVCWFIVHGHDRGPWCACVCARPSPPPVLWADRQSGPWWMRPRVLARAVVFAIRPREARGFGVALRPAVVPACPRLGGVPRSYAGSGCWLILLELDQTCARPRGPVDRTQHASELGWTVFSARAIGQCLWLYCFGLSTRLPSSILLFVISLWRL